MNEQGDGWLWRRTVDNASRVAIDLAERRREAAESLKLSGSSSIPESEQPEVSVESAATGESDKTA